MTADGTGERTEKATPSKRREARKKGQVLKSTEVNTAIMTLALFGLIAILGGNIAVQMGQSLQSYLGSRIANLPGRMDREMAAAVLSDALLAILKTGWPIFLVAVLVGLTVNLAQTGFLLVGEGLKPKFSKINPLSGLKRIFSMRSVVEMLKAVMKITIIFVIVYLEYISRLDTFGNLMAYGIMAAAKQIFGMCLSAAFKACVALVVLAFADYFYQWWDYEKNLKMTKQEVVEEWKREEGDPKVKGAIKKRQREMAMRRMMQEIPKADVVITNPTHYAIALKYEHEKDHAPVVIAKGKDLVAQRIKERAREHGIELVENKPVAQALYLACEIGDEIPEEMYAAVIEILHYVFRLKGKMPSKVNA